MNNYETAATNLLKNLEVSTNIQLFSTQWINENGLRNTDELLSLFDRIHLPYEIVPKLHGKHNSKHIIAFYDEDDVSLSFGNTSDNKNRKPAFYLVVLGLPLEKHPIDWVGNRINAFKPMLPKLIVVSLIINVFALIIPFITMAIYDHVIGGNASHELMGIAIGAGLILLMMGLLRTLRSKVLVSLSNRVSREISQNLIKKLLQNAYAQNQQTSSSNHQNQVLLAERVSSVLSGPLGSALFDLPFVIIFLLAIGLLGGWLVLVPLIALMMYFLLSKMAISESKKNTMQSTIAGTNRQTFINEISSKLIFLRSAGMEKHWISRFEKVNFLASKVGFKQAVKQHKYTSLHYAITLCATIATIGLGIGLIFENIMSAGGLIASMMLISRITGPAQTLANSASRLVSFNLSKTQINRLLTQPSERDFNYQHHELPSSPPAITLDQVTFRYPKQVRPALSAISFTIEQGEVVAVSGPSGSGKTSLIELLAGLQLAQNGTVELDGINLSQYDPQLFRHWAYIRAADPELLSLSIREWLSDGKEMTDHDMINAINHVGGKSWFDSLENGLDSIISSLIPDTLFDIASGVIAQVLIDAKTLVFDYKLMLMDNPVPDFNPDAKKAFSEFIRDRQGQATIIYTSHDPDLIKLADKVIILNEGAVVYAGPLEQTNQEKEPAHKEVSNG